MSVSVPSQRQRCPVYSWCIASGTGHIEHIGEVNLITTERGREVRVNLQAERDRTPGVIVEVTFEEGGPGMQVVDLGAPEALELAGIFLRLARDAWAARDRDLAPGG